MKRTLSAKRLLKRVMTPHTDLALQLLAKMKSRSSGDPVSGFHISAIVIFLSGVDKVLSLTLQLLYLAGKVEWKWLAQKKSRHVPGVIMCDRGFDAKLRKLKELGLDFTELEWLADLRNSYIHDMTIYAGYKISVPEKGELRFTLRAHGPEIPLLGKPLTGVTAKTIKQWATTITEEAGIFVDRAGWYKSWEALAEQIERLPADLQPELDQVKNSDSDNRCREIVMALNGKFVGAGLAKLLNKPE